MIPPTYKPKKKFMQLAIAEAKRAGDRGDYPIGAVVTRVIGEREVVIASAGNRVKTSGSSIKHVELETLKICFLRLRPVSTGFRVVFHARTLCYVRGRLRLAENRCGGIRRFAGRYHRLRQKTRYRGIQMARLSHFVQIRPRKRGTSYSRLWQFFKTGVPKVIRISSVLNEHIHSTRASPPPGRAGYFRGNLGRGL